MSTREEWAAAARELAVSYERSLVGCGHASFAAVVDALRRHGCEIVTPGIEEELIKGLVGFSGGLGNLGSGSCGSLTGAGFAIGLATAKYLAPNGIGGGSELTNEPRDLRARCLRQVAAGVGSEFLRRFGGLTCRDIWLDRFGKALNWRMPGRSKEHFETAERVKCRGPESCTIPLAAGWAAETIWDMVENGARDTGSPFGGSAHSWVAEIGGGLPEVWAGEVDCGCAAGTFRSIEEALASRGVRLAPVPVLTEASNGLRGLSGGVGSLGMGNCGALTGAAMAIGLASGVGRREIERDSMNRWITYDNVAETIARKFWREFGGFSCRDVTWTRWGKWYDKWNPVGGDEFVAEREGRGCRGIETCTQRLVAGWAVECVSGIIEHPRTLEMVKTERGDAPSTIVRGCGDSGCCQPGFCKARLP